MKFCQICRNGDLKRLIDFGEQPISHRFKIKPEQNVHSHPILLEQCNNCGLIQLSQPADPEALKAIYPWVTYNEPEDHLNKITRKIITLFEARQSDFETLGISYKDKSLLNRLNERGYGNTKLLDPKIDLGITDPLAGIETLQHGLTPESARQIKKERGTFDLIITRHLLEHAEDLLTFIHSLLALLKRGGYLVVEVPGFEEPMKTYDYSFPWAEHTAYFTEQTYTTLWKNLEQTQLVSFEAFEYPTEQCLVSVVKKIKDGPLELKEVLETPTRELEVAQKYGTNFPASKRRIRTDLTRLTEERGKLALFGAGHRGCAFVNILELEDYFEFVADDDPNKQSKYLPGTTLKILNSSELQVQNIKLALLTLGPGSEKGIQKKHSDFIDSGGEFRSIFRNSDISIRSMTDKEQ